MVIERQFESTRVRCPIVRSLVLTCLVCLGFLAALFDRLNDVAKAREMTARATTLHQQGRAFATAAGYVAHAICQLACTDQPR